MKPNKGVCKAGLLLALVAVLPATATQTEQWTTDYPLPPGGRVSVANVQGSIWVEGWDRAEVELTVKKSAQGAGARLADVEIIVEPRADSLEVETYYGGGTDEPVTVDYCLRVPRQVRLEGLRTVNGDITVRNVEGFVEAQTLNGNVKQTGVAGSIRAHTVNGSVHVALRALPEAAGGLQLETINGDLRLLLPAAADADLELSTVAGRIESDLLAPTRALAGDTSSTRARLGRGGVNIRLRTIRGNIEVAENNDLL
jgi:hypothetical protein